MWACHDKGPRAVTLLFFKDIKPSLRGTSFMGRLKEARGAFENRENRNSNPSHTYGQTWSFFPGKPDRDRFILFACIDSTTAGSFLL